VLHAIAYAPDDALGGRFMTAPAASASEAFVTSAFSFKALAAALAPLMPAGGSFVGMDFDASVAWPIYDWMGVAKAALESVSRYLARDLGRAGVRVNLVSARAARDGRGARDPGVRAARLAVVLAGAARLGRERSATGGARDLLAAVGLLGRDHGRDRARRRGVPRNWRPARVT
jgi:enoyl-[acyl-carrier protein] reductase I